jgi:hypothetical protein
LPVRHRSVRPAGRTDISTILDPCRYGNVERGAAPPSGNGGGFDFFSISA